MVLKQKVNEHMIAIEHSNLEPFLDDRKVRIPQVRCGNLSLQIRMLRHLLYEDDCLERAILLLAWGQRKECLANRLLGLEFRIQQKAGLYDDGEP